MFFVMIKYEEDEADPNGEVTYGIHAGPFAHLIDAVKRAQDVAQFRPNDFYVVEVNRAFRQITVPPIEEFKPCF